MFLLILFSEEQTNGKQTDKIRYLGCQLSAAYFISCALFTKYLQTHSPRGETLSAHGESVYIEARDKRQEARQGVLTAGLVFCALCGHIFLSLTSGKQKQGYIKGGEGLSDVEINDLFKSCIDEHSDMVTRICMLMLGNMIDAQDAYLAVFEKLYIQLKKSPPDEADKWLARVAYNESLC